MNNTINHNDLAVCYPVMEHFYTLQGEGAYAGYAAYFIRLGGCDVGCVWCDVKESWDAAAHPQLSVSEMLQHVLASKTNRVVITGGEPCMYDLHALCNVLHAHGLQIHLETSGAHEIRGQFDWVTLSPKIDMPGNKIVLAENVARANEIKMPVGKAQDIEKLKQLLQQHAVTNKLIWLQPLSCKENPTKLCIEAALANNWRLSAQVHKYINIR